MIVKIYDQSDSLLKRREDLRKKIDVDKMHALIEHYGSEVV